MNCSNKIPSFIVLLLISLLSIISCKKATLPVVRTVTVTQILQNSAYSGGQVTSDGNARITSVGVCWNTSGDPTITDSKAVDSTEAISFTVRIKGLTPNTSYYLKAFASNSEGTAYGDQVTFTTDPVAIPTLITSVPKSLTTTTGGGGGNISNDGGIPVTDRGVCWNTGGSPDIAGNHTSDGTGTGLFSSTLTDLIIGNTYFVRAYATNSLGTAYGNEVQFTQIEPVTDYDGNAYGIVTIGTQIWMAENLRTTTFKDGLRIPYVTASLDWAKMTTSAFCWYNNNESEFKSTYGGLYNWYAVNSGKLCPAGWHVPSVTEFSTLVTYLGGSAIAGGKLKEAGTFHWAEPNLEANNGSGFTALPGGGRYNIHSDPGVFSDLSYGCYTWSATESTNDVYAYSYDLNFNKGLITKNEYSKRDGESVRCIKDSK